MSAGERGFIFDDWMKGMPASAPALSSCDIARLKLNLLREDLSLPCAILKESALRANEAWMGRFARDAGVLLCPHGKTTMSPELFARQLAAGAWGITAATPHQLKVMRRFGVPRVLYANQLIGRQAIEYVVSELERDPGFDFYCLVDSVDAVNLLGAAAANSTRPIKVLLEMGQRGGRTGVRTCQDGLGVAAAIAGQRGLQLAGVEAYEFIVSARDEDERDRNMARMFADFAELTHELDRRAWFGSPQIVLTAGGSGAFDLAAQAITSLRLSRPVIPVIRSGCYLTQDHGWLPGYFDRMRERSSVVAGVAGRPADAMEIWGYVQSRPEPELVLATIGKRDVSHDIHLPRPTLWFRPGIHGHPQPIAEGTTIQALNDQHAYVRVTPQAPLRVGDMIAVGMSHPCTTFDKWRSMFIVDDDYTVIDAISTWF